MRDKVACLECNAEVELEAPDTIKLELFYNGKTSKNIVCRTSFFHWSCFFNFLGGYLKRAEELEVVKESSKRNSPEIQKNIVHSLVFNAIMMDLTNGLEDYLFDEASIRLKVSGKEIETIDRKFSE